MGPSKEERLLRDLHDDRMYLPCRLRSHFVWLLHIRHALQLLQGWNSFQLWRLFVKICLKEYLEAVRSETRRRWLVKNAAPLSNRIVTLLSSQIAEELRKATICEPNRWFFLGLCLGQDSNLSC